MGKKWLILCCLAFFPMLCVHGLDPDKPLDQYAINSRFRDMGLPQSSVLTIIQSRDGYLWFGTYEGLARFNGVGFTVFSKTNVPQLKNNGIYHLLEDSQGDLWVATPNGLIHRKHETGEIKRYSTEDGLSHEFVTHLLEDRRTRIWVGTTRGLNRFDKEKEAFIPYTLGDGLLGSSYITALSEDSNGDLWIGTYNNGVGRITNDGFKHYNTETVLPSNNIQAMCCGGSGRTWIGTRKGLVLFEPKGDGIHGTFTVFSGKDGLSDDTITALFRDSRDILWIGTYKGDLNRYKNGVFSSISLGSEVNNKISAIREDAEGSLWVGTYRSGMFQITNRKFLRYNKLNGLPVNNIRTVTQDKNGTTWIGTVGGGLVRFSNGRFKSYGEKEGLLNNGIWSIACAPDGAVWFGTYGGGLHRLKNGIVTPYKTHRSESKDVVRAVFVDSRNNIWAGTDGGGLDLFRDGRFIKNYNTNTGLTDDYIYSINEDNHGTIWVGTFNGGINLIDRDGRIRTLGKKEGLPQNAVWVIHPEKDGTIWVGTNDGGLCRYKDGKFFIFTSRDGLFSDTAFQILEYDGYFWMNCNTGIYRVGINMLNDFAAGKIKRIQCTFFGREDGFYDVEGTGPAQPAGFVNRNGQICFPSLNGIILITPDDTPVNNIPPPVAIENIIINGKRYNPNDKAMIAPGKGEVEINYAGLSYLLPAKVRFKYKLDGYNKEWIDAGNRRSVFYTNLSPGIYYFRVIACNSDGIWNKKGVSYSFVLKPHFYQTWAFYAVIFILFCLLVYMVIHYRDRLHTKRADQLQKLVDEQTLELRTANLRLAELSTLDGLTEIGNRRIFEEYLEKEWRRCQRNQLPLSLLMVDVDFFKLYNDTYGHQKGDIVLKSVAIVLAHSVSRSGDLAARYGGEEFAVILGETEKDGAVLIAEKLRERVEHLEIYHSRSTVSDRLTVSIGCATTIPAEGKKPSGLVHAADTALYQAKRSGRNQVAAVFLDPQL